MVEPDEERRPLLKRQQSAEDYPGLPWSQVVVLGIWRGTHVRLRHSLVLSLACLVLTYHVLAGSILRLYSDLVINPSLIYDLCRCLRKVVI